MNLIYSKILDNYPTHVELSKSQRAKYYDFPFGTESKDVKLPKKYQDYHKYDFTRVEVKGKTVFRLYEKETNLYIIKNEAKVGTPRTQLILANDLFSQRANGHIQSKVLNTIKEWFFTHWTIDDAMPLQWYSIQYPLTFKFIYCCPNEVDIDNYRIYYEKAIIDCLKVFTFTRESSKHKQVKVDNPFGFLPEDKSSYLKGIWSEWQQSNERKLILEFYES